jgi:hypothetical protein
VRRADNHHLQVPIVLKSGSLNLLDPSGPVQACKGIAYNVTKNVKLCRHKNYADVNLQPYRKHSVSFVVTEDSKTITNLFLLNPSASLNVGNSISKLQIQVAT